MLVRDFLLVNGNLCFVACDDFAEVLVLAHSLYYYNVYALPMEYEGDMPEKDGLDGSHLILNGAPKTVAIDAIRQYPDNYRKGELTSRSRERFNSL